MGPEAPREECRRRYPLFPRLLFVLDGTGPAGVDHHVRALRTAAGRLAPDAPRGVPVLAAALADILHDEPCTPVRRPVQDPDRRVGWNH
ncbi:hypothetical protein [Streptomyces sp. Tu 3180]|uniref:hypothetical protein n=1 Tax=Streptomyces sp. Tu 3180 TaxID=2682611 RepID=UPI00135A377C|nr:hypothetical protein [Streptomyces sp. Tu 3180]KAF3463371.1 hypothetical protein GL259_02815 [Streptomyces sp. Tu 3180]